MFYKEYGFEKKVSLLGYGCMRFPEKNGKIDREAATPLLRRAFDEGVTYFDAAYRYHGGDSEVFLAEFLKGLDRESYNVATKLPSWMMKEKGDAERIFNEQLETLGVGYFDFYLLHALDLGEFEKLVSLGIVDLIAEKKAQGLIKNYGFSFHDRYEAFEKIIKHRKWDFCQLQINYMDINEQAGLRGLALAKSLGVPVVVMEPVKGGALAKLPRDVAKPLHKLEPDMSDASWAIRYAASLDGVMCVLSGMSNMAQVDDNLSSFAPFRQLDGEQMALMEEISKQMHARVRNGCTGCAYCMPCPQGIDIPTCFRIWNNYGVYHAKTWASQSIKHHINEKNTPANCIECGACEAICPQSLPIIEDLKRFRAELMKS